MKRLLRNIGFLLLLGTSSARAEKKSLLVVLDPGHGGNDLGTSMMVNGKRLSEKDLSLQLAKRFAEELRNRDHRVVLTRTKDEELPVTERTSVANRLKADVFVSIHLNSLPATNTKSIPEGIETYILNSTTDQNSKRLADLENAVLKGSIAGPGAGRAAEVGLILKDLLLEANRPDSRKLACELQKELVSAFPVGETRKKDRGVRQALFYVLLGADMPSVLLEVGFLANAKDRAWLISDLGQLKMSRAFANAIEGFHRSKSGHCQIHGQ